MRPVEPSPGRAAAVSRVEPRPDVPPAAGPELVGVDFSSAPSRRKPIVVARGVLGSAGPGGAAGGAADLHLLALECHGELESFGRWLARPGHWVGAFDFPFGLPRELVQQLDWPADWRLLMRSVAELPRARLRATLVDFCAARPPGGKFAHRACDRPAGSSPSMKWVNPPVVFMLQAGVPLLIEAGVDLPGLHRGDPARVALEGYPGLLARALIGRVSYKADAKARQTAARRAAREALLAALEQGGRPAGRMHLPRLVCAGPGLRQHLIDDAAGDALDAVLCLCAAAWAAGRPGFGLPAGIDPIEGWIVGA